MKFPPEDEVRALREFNAKRLRAGHIAGHMGRAGIRMAVCFTCGNAASALREAGVDVVEVGVRGAIAPLRWWTPGEIARAWPSSFDATSGHLPAWMMWDMAAEMSRLFPNVNGHPLIVPSGSGETAACVAVAFPRSTVTAAYDDRFPPTRFSPDAPLNRMVARMCAVSRGRREGAGLVVGHGPEGFLGE